MLNAIVHPAVKEEIQQEDLSGDRTQKYRSDVVLKAALLMEEHYDEICDEVWYIYASEDSTSEDLNDLEICKRIRGYAPCTEKQGSNF